MILKSSLVAVLALLVSGTAVAQTGSLEDRVKALEIKTEEKKAPATGTGVQAYFDDGLQFRTDDKSFMGHVGAFGIFHYTNNATFNDSDSRFDGFTIKMVAIDVEARLWQAFSGFVRATFTSGGSSLFLGWAEFNKWDAFKIRVGLMKVPYSQEFLEDPRWTDMPENSLLGMSVPGRDLGLMVFGTPIEGGIFQYWLGLYNGTGPSAGTENNSDKELSIRLALRPGAKAESDAIKHLTLAVSYTRGVAGRNSGAPTTFQAPASGTIFHFGPTTFVSDYERTRFGVDLVWIWGPLSVKGEWSYFKSKHKFADGSHDPMRNVAYMGEIGFWLLGSTRLNNKRPQIKKALFQEGGFGDIQIVGRYAKVDLSDTLENEAGWAGSRNAQEVAFGLNYYPNSFVRVSAMYVYYRYDHEDSRRFVTPDGQRIDNESVFVFRAQIDF
ncbi:MAG: hypothetical protein FD180_2972 [Planctomycetota bacterium]|nr:MAG: hypothetical protein FD180_2972 [Planctomycetota bacterium]